MTVPTLWDHELLGPAQAVLPSLIRAVPQYASPYDLLYVGRTKNPWKRMAAHRFTWAIAGNTLHHMVKIYKTNSFADMVKVEAKLIEYIRHYSGKTVLNKIFGDWDDSIVFYLYMLLDDGSKKREISTDVDWDQMEHRGLFSENIGKIKKKIEILGEDQEYVYVGFTDDPDKRFSQHQKIYIKSESWSQMVVLFESGNLHDTYLGENKIIQSTIKNFGSEKCLNASIKSELRADQYYFVYVLVGNSGV